MFGSGRARSGTIVLPCGAGKTLVGVTACCTVGRGAVVLCSSGTAVEQWRQQFRLWSTVAEQDLVVFTSQTPKTPPVNQSHGGGKACILLTTWVQAAIVLDAFLGVHVPC